MANSTITQILKGQFYIMNSSEEGARPAKSHTLYLWTDDSRMAAP